MVGVAINIGRRACVWFSRGAIYKVYYRRLYSTLTYTSLLPVPGSQTLPSRERVGFGDKTKR